MKKSIGYLIVLFIVIICYFFFNDSYAVLEKEVSSLDNPYIEVHFLDVGQGDSIFIEINNSKTMLIDASTSSYGNFIIDYINSLGYDRIDYLIATHPHADHIGSMQDIVLEYDIGDRVIFTGKISDRELLKRIYSASDLLTFPSLYDNASIVIIEASAFALPSLLINGAVCSEGAINDFNAFLTEENADIYAAAMKRIFSNAELRYNVGHNAQNTLFKSKESAINDVRERYIQIIAAYKNRIPNGMI